MLWTISMILVILWMVGTGERSHHCRIHSYTAGSRNGYGVDQNYSGTKTCVNDLQVLIAHSYINKKEKQL